MTSEEGQGQAPLAGVILCCSSLKTEIRDDVHKVATEMGARCTYDLTLENTHLIVGDLRTPKYRYVAKERPDVKVLLPSFVDAVRDAWMGGGSVDIAPLEVTHQAPALHGLSICLTGFSDAQERSAIIARITSHGAKYEGDLSRHTTSHLIARSATGKKYQMAPQWDIAVVAEEWLRDSIDRGMSLEESYYGLNLVPEARGVGAWNRTYKPRASSPGKRSRDSSTSLEAQGRRKLRRTMSSKLSVEHAAMWANITAMPEKERSRHEQWTTDVEPAINQKLQNHATKQPAPKTFSKPKVPGSIFSDLTVYLHDFQKSQTDILQAHLGSNGATCIDTKAQLSTESSTETIKFLMLPASIPSSKLSPLPLHLQEIPQVTEWWLEACLHSKEVVDPSESRFHEPFYQNKISGFESLKIASTALNTMERLNLSRAVKLLGGSYSETIQAGVSVVVANTSSTKPNRIAGASKLGLPVVKMDWLWACVRSNCVMSFDPYPVMSNTLNRNLAQDAQDTFSFSTMRTLSVPSDETERRISERTSRNASRSNLGGKIDQNSSILCDEDVQLHADQAARQDQSEAGSKQPLSPPASQQRRQMQPLQQASPQRLNSPSKPSSPSKTSERLAAEDEISSAKSEQINSALVAMLTEKRLNRQSSSHTDDRQTSRRKRTALGRAISNATDPARNSRQNSPEEMTEEYQRELEQKYPMPSQKIVYEEHAARVRHQKLIAELGGGEVVEVSVCKVDNAATAAMATSKTSAATTRSKTRKRT